MQCNWRHELSTSNVGLTGIGGQFGEVAVNRFNLISTHYQVKSAECVADPPQIRAGLWFSYDRYLSPTFKSAQRVKAGGQLSPSEIKAGDGQVPLVGNNSYIVN